MKALTAGQGMVGHHPDDGRPSGVSLVTCYRTSGPEGTALETLTTAVDRMMFEQIISRTGFRRSSQ